MSDSGGFKPQAFCFTGFAGPSTLPAGTLLRPWLCFPMGQLQQQCWSSCAPDGLLHKLPGRRKPGWQFRMFPWQVDGLSTSSGLHVWWAAKITTVCNSDIVWGLAGGVMGSRVRFWANCALAYPQPTLKAWWFIFRYVGTIFCCLSAESCSSPCSHSPSWQR